MKNKLLSFDNLECPFCDKICKPISILKNNTVVYEKHDCINENDYSFKIDEDGDLVED